MRKINNIISPFLLITLFLFAGCDKFLDITPTGKVIPTTIKDYRQMMTGAYDNLPNDRGLTAMRSDEVDLSAKTATLDINSYKEIWIWKDNAQASSTRSFEWMNYYKVLYLASYTIEKGAEIKITSTLEEEERKQLIGESYMLRAYCHFLLVNLYGAPYDIDPEHSKGIPLRLNTNTEILLKRNTVAEVYRSVLDDIANAEKLINKKQWSEGLTYRFNTVSVNALRSRVYLYMGKWSEALAAAQKVLQEKNTLVDMNLSGGKTLPNHYLSPEAIVSLEQPLSNDLMKASTVGFDFRRLYDDSKYIDYRLNTYYKGYDVIKGGTNSYKCTFRVAEIYLNAAEAALQDPHTDIAEARTYLLKLMANRYKSTNYPKVESYINGLNATQLLQEIYDERARELAFEGHRWFDLRRTTRPQIKHDFYNGNTLIESYTLEKNDARYTIPIPLEARLQNPNLND